MSRRKYRPRYTANPGPMPPDIPPSSPADAAPMNHGGASEIGTAAPEGARLALGQRVAELEAAERFNAAAQPEAALRAQSPDPVDQLPHASPAMKEWMRGHREIFTDARKAALAQAGHFLALADGVVPDSHEYFQRLEHAITHPQPTHHAHEPAAAHPHPETNGGHPVPQYPAAPPAMPRGLAAPVSRSGGVPSGGAGLSSGVLC